MSNSEVKPDEVTLLDSRNQAANEDSEALESGQNDGETALVHNLKHFVKHLSDAGKFSYLGLCSTVLTLLYCDDFDREYRHKVVKLLVEHVQLESNPLRTMIALCDGHAMLETDAFVESLMEEQIMKVIKTASELDHKDSPVCIAEDLVLWSLVSSCTKDSAGGRYDARTRILIRHITWRLHIQLETLESVEEKMIKLLQEDNNDEDAQRQAEDRTKNDRRRKWRSYAMIGAAAVGGGAIIGLTGGLAAPLVAAGAGAILGASTAAALGSVAGIAIITSVFGAAGAGLTGYKMKRRVGGIDQFLFRPLTAGKQLAVTIAISGWLSSNTGEGDFTVPWISMRQSSEQYCLVWETEHLLRLGGAFEYILDSLISVAANEALKYTILSGLLTAIAWPASLLAASSVIDNPWSVCLQRSVQVGKELAEVLLARQHGHRPVTLIGYSLGARVIYCCLEEMARRKNHSGIVEDVVLLGAPVTGEAEQWEKFSKVVAGHITNGYCKSDWLLRFLYRTSSQQTEVAGLQPIKWNDRRMINIDLSSVVEGHMDYRKRMPEILSAVGVRSEADSLEVASQMSTSAKPPRSKSLNGVDKKQKNMTPRSATAIGIVDIVEADEGKSDNIVETTATTSLEHEVPRDDSSFVGLEMTSEKCENQNNNNQHSLIDFTDNEQSLKFNGGVAPNEKLKNDELIVNAEHCNLIEESVLKNEAELSLEDNNVNCETTENNDEGNFDFNYDTSQNKSKEKNEGGNLGSGMQEDNDFDKSCDEIQNLIETDEEISVPELVEIELSAVSKLTHDNAMNVDKEEKQNFDKQDLMPYTNLEDQALPTKDHSSKDDVFVKQDRTFDNSNEITDSQEIEKTQDLEEMEAEVLGGEHLTTASGGALKVRKGSNFKIVDEQNLDQQDSTSDTNLQKQSNAQSFVSDEISSKVDNESALKHGDDLNNLNQTQEVAGKTKILQEGKARFLPHEHEVELFTTSENINNKLNCLEKEEDHMLKNAQGKYHHDLNADVDAEKKLAATQPSISEKSLNEDVLCEQENRNIFTQSLQIQDCVGRNAGHDNPEKLEGTLINGNNTATNHEIELKEAVSDEQKFHETNENEQVESTLTEQQLSEMNKPLDELEKEKSVLQSELVPDESSNQEMITSKEKEQNFINTALPATTETSDVGSEIFLN